MSATSTTQSVASGAPPAEVSQQEFLQHINAMQQHYRAMDPTVAQSASPYLLPAHLTFTLPPVAAAASAKPAVQEIAQSAGTAAPNEEAERLAPTLARLVAIGTPAQASQLLAAALDNQQQRTLAFISRHRSAMLHAVAAARDPKSTQTFAQRMNALREEAKADHRARIDAMFASLNKIGTAHAAARPVILHAGNKVATFVSGVAAGATNVVGTVISAVAAGGSAIGKAADTVGKWASDAADKVKHFFGGLF
jgi:hypothetical protein